VAVMYLGRIVELASREEIYKNPLHPYTQILLKAIPQLDPNRRGSSSPLSGELPSLFALPHGCPFAPRCPRAKKQCRRQHPLLTEVAPGHSVACLAV
jgi:peptide/nickel transport system ATP-binding protein